MDIQAVGAFDCGAEDQHEVCIATCDWVNKEYGAYLDYEEVHGHPPRNGKELGVPPCPIHVNQECPEPGSNRHNPYTHYDTTETDGGLGR